MQLTKKFLVTLIMSLVLNGLIITQVVAQTPIAEIDNNTLVKPKSITLDHSLDKATVAQTIRAAQLFYTFWNTGNRKYLDAVVAPTFIDHTLPKGRPQGPKGLLFASNNFRKAVPDLHCAIEDLLVSGDKVTARLILSGTFTGNFNNHPPTGKPIKFIAIDILHIKNGQLIEDWHLEDNLNLLQQLNVVKM